jgi:hypothetical protein
VILSLAILAGLLAGLGWARWRRQPYQSPELRRLWLVFIAFLPQFIVIYLPITRDLFPDWVVAVFLVVSQILLLVFVWLNRHIFGALILLCGVVFNLSVMTANGGFMPINPQTASRVVSEDVLRNVQPGSRIGPKDILLHPHDTRFEWLADRFLLPSWIPHQVAFSIGDVFIAVGAFLLLANPTPSMQFIQRGVST